MSIAEVGLDGDKDEGTRTETETRRSMGRSCPKTHAKKGRNWADLPHTNGMGMGMGRFACGSARPGNGIYTTRVQREETSTLRI